MQVDFRGHAARTSNSASTATSDGSQTSDMGADREVALAIAQRHSANGALLQVVRGKERFQFDHSAIPSNSVPDWFTRGRP